MNRRVLLLSGGLDSAALAVEARPEHSLFIDYGQRPAVAEMRAASAIATATRIDHHELEVSSLRALGIGLLASDGGSTGPSPEWWPFRNQLLVTLAAGWVVKTFGLRDEPEILIGSVAGDGERHVDGTHAFYESLDRLIALQEGSIRVSAPGIDRNTDALISESGITDDILAWTHSCHVSSVPCAECPGCAKRYQVLNRLGRL